MVHLAPGVFFGIHSPLLQAVLKDKVHVDVCVQQPGTVLMSVNCVTIKGHECLWSVLLPEAMLM